MLIKIPPTFTQEHHKVLTTYLTDSRRLRSFEWPKVYQAIDFLEQAQIIFPSERWSFRRVYNEYIDRLFADLYLDRLLILNDIPNQNPALVAMFARQIRTTLEQANLLYRNIPNNWLLLAYCIYWWQSFTRGYTFEVEIIRDLHASGLIFEAHDLRSRSTDFGRYSEADLMVLELTGDIKTSTYFLKFQPSRQIHHDFYITRLYQQGKERTLVVFQKPLAWKTINGEVVYEGTLDDIPKILPQPLRLQQNNVTLIVIDYTLWKQKVLQKQQSKGDQDVRKTLD